MTQDFDPYFQEIGRLALEAAAEDAGKLLVYAELADGELDADIFFQDPDSDLIQYRLAPPMLAAVIEAFHAAWSAADPERTWRAMAFVIEDEGFRLDLTYGSEIEALEDEAEDDISHRRPAKVREVFGEAMVDYSRPGA